MKAIQDPSQKNQNEIVLLVRRQSTKAMQVIALLFMFNASLAQVFYGTTSGGAYGTGSIFKVNGDGTGYQETHMKASNGSNNRGYARANFDRYSLTQFSNGKFYGVTITGGSSSEGILFEFDPITKEYTEKIDFDFYNISVPTSSMLEYGGKLYGTSVGMGYFIYSFNPATNSYKVEYTLPSQSPGLILHDGKFYGMTTRGGVQRAGALFEYNPTTGEYNALFSFNRTTSGYFPEGGLTYYNGKLYGVTTTGGQYAQGTLFEYDLSTHQFEKKIDFKDNVTGGVPIGDLTIYNNKLLGIASHGGDHNLGVLFEFDLTTEILHKAIDFSTELPPGAFKLINEKLYGVATDGGTEGEGVLFSIDPQTFEYMRLFEFDEDETGGHPFGQLMLYGNTLVGVTKSGGYSNGGVIFKYDLVSDQLHVELSFNYSPFGKRPLCLLEVDSTFYGLTSEGGANGDGVLFKLDPNTFAISNLHDFNCDSCDENKDPRTKGKLLVVDNLLYGITTKAGNDKGGELFMYDIDQESYTTLAEFNTNETGLSPMGSIAMVNGKIYGTTKRGGSENLGVLFEYDLENSTFQIKQDLSYYGTGLELELTYADNSLYGLGSSGSFDHGIIDTYNPDDNTFTLKYEFQNSANGIYPTGELTSGSSKVFGVTTYGGAYNNGVIFEFDTQTQTYQSILDFTDYGYPPMGTMVFHDNKLYGARNGGTLFQFDLDNAQYETLINIRVVNDFNDRVNSLIVHDGEFHTSIAIINEVIEFSQGKRKDGKVIDINKSDPQTALYLADSYDSPNNGAQFVSLGFGGSITLAFDHQLYNKPGMDLYVYETSYGNPSFYDYPEQAEIFVSQNGDEWTSLGYTHAHSSDPGNVSGPQEACRGKLDSNFDLQTSGLDWIQFVKVVDVTDPLAKRRDRNVCAESEFFAFNSASDGFDLDAIHHVKILYPSASSPSGRRASDNSSAMINISAPNATALLYPNPASSILSIDMSEEQELAIMEDDFHLEIIDTQGKTWTNARELMDENWTINHDVSNLNPGMYIARVTNGNVRRHYKFMKK
ncbi:MAG: choice-of-anchor tandem repeat GloVer-containing protein [Chryseolinea sp.]